MLSLGALSRDDTAALVRRVVPDADDAARAARLGRLARLPPRRRPSWRTAAGAATGEVSLSRLWLHALPRTVLEALRTVAVLGTTFDTDEFVAVTAPGDDDDEQRAVGRARGVRRARPRRAGPGGRAHRARLRVPPRAGARCRARRRARPPAARAAPPAPQRPCAGCTAHPPGWRTTWCESGDRAAAVPYVLRAAETEAAMGAFGSALTTLDCRARPGARRAPGPDASSCAPTA